VKAETYIFITRYQGRLSTHDGLTSGDAWPQTE
jgi:hypothetical protein